MRHFNSHLTFPLLLLSYNSHMGLPHFHAHLAPATLHLTSDPHKILTFNFTMTSFCLLSSQSISPQNLPWFPFPNHSGCWVFSTFDAGGFPKLLNSPVPLPCARFALHLAGGTWMILPWKVIGRLGLTHKAFNGISKRPASHACCGLQGWTPRFD